MTGSTEQVVTKTSLRVLVVEDSADDADLVLEDLRVAGYAPEYTRVDTAASLREALREHSWQLVLCDYSMPAFDALDALAIVKELGLDLPFIIISGMTGEESAVAAMKAGAHDFLIKGKLSRLIPAVERELREAAVRAERTAMQQQLLVSDRLVQIGMLAAGVAHEINNPLAYVIGNLGYAIDQLSRGGTLDARKLSEPLKQALEGAERIRATSADLRVFSRTDDSDGRPVDLQRVLESSINMSWNQIRHRARLVRDFEEVPAIAANENRLGQVFLNLLVNAAQAIPEGNAAEHEIQVHLRGREGQAEIEVSDSGVGITPEVRERLFQPFFTTKPRDVGTGLGLSICQKIVRDLGGEITVHPNPKSGTTFRVRLPLGQAERTAKAAREEVGYTSSRRGRILVIDDEPAIVELIERLLDDEHDTVGCTSARVALRFLASDRAFDAILCDLMMPDMSGAEFYDQLRELAPQLVQRVVFLTGGAFTAAGRQLLARVDAARVEKPFDSTTLRRVVREQVARVDASDGPHVARA